MVLTKQMHVRSRKSGSGRRRMDEATCPLVGTWCDCSPTQCGTLLAHEVKLELEVAV